ncbi:PAS domain S-box protein [Pedobacter sp. GR22-6]|uniref:PAS domain S-box protein n=1 Tax=Pedobacter sp. GR22-6 TaxID=3127957 RepID=UPI00307D9EAC
MADLPKGERERLQALKSYQILDTLPEKDFDRLTELASLICDTPISLVSLMDEHRQWFKSKLGLDAAETAREISFCEHVISSHEFMEIEDAQKDLRFKDNPLVTAAPEVRFYAGYPLIDDNGHALGTLCVLDKVPKVLTGPQKKALKLLAEEVISLITERRLKEELRHFEKLFHFSKDLICIADARGFFIKINPSFTHLLKWPAEQLRNTSLYTLVHPEDLEHTRKEIGSLSRDNRTVSFKNRVRTMDDEYKTLQWNITAETATDQLFIIIRDITEETNKEQLIIDKENRFRAFFENAHGLMCTHDLKGKILSLNSASANSLGYTIPELEEMTLFDIIQKDHLHELEHYLAEIKLNGRMSGLMHTVHRDGSSRIWLFNNVLVKSQSEQDYIIGNALDITERHQLEMEFRKTKEMLLQTNRVARIGGWEIDLQANKLTWSSITKEIHDVPEDFEPDIVSAIEFYKDEANKELITKAVNEAAAYGHSFDMELQIITATKREIWVRAMGYAQLQHGKPARIYGTFQDIDAKKKAELEIRESRKLFENLLQSASEVSIIATDEAGIITVFNKGAENLTGYTASEMIGRQSPALIHDPREIALREEELLLEYNTPIKGVRVLVYKASIEGSEQREWTYIRKDGSKFTVSLVVSAMRDTNYNLIGYLGISTDISERKQAEQELEKAKLLAEQANVAKSEFLANMSHEIRTPLNGVIGFTDLVLKTNLTETQHQYMGIVNQSAHALLSIINDILDFSKIEAGKLELDIDKCDLIELTNQASDIITYQVQNKYLEMLLNISADLPRFIWADQVRLKQVLVNLLGNSSKFTEKGEIELKISQLESSGEEVTLRFEVRDTGIGIKPDKQTKIFEAFSQEDASTTKKYGGTGLGLTISNKLLGLMGSKLSLKSEFGKGSTFYFDLKVRAEHGDPIKWEDIDIIKRVLIVDDNENNRLILKRMLALKNIKSDEAKNGLEALEILDRNDEYYDVILMDYHMPYINGLDTVRKIREMESNGRLHPIVLLHSSSDDELIINSCRELRIDQRLLKPIKIQEMFDMLSRIFKKREHNRYIYRETEQKKTLHHFKVLIAEDNAINMLLAKTVVRRIDPDAIIVEAANGLEAVEKFLGTKPDIIFMDIQMPEMNGYEAAKAIRKIGNTDKHVPIVAITAGNVKGEREKCLKAGMDDFITKPFVEEAVIAIIDKWNILKK